MKRIAFFQNDLKVGGIQKALINLLHGISSQEYEVDVYLFNKNSFYQTKLPDNIRFYYLKPLPYWNRFIYFDMLKLFVGHRYCINKEYDVAVDFCSYANECSLATLSVPSKKRIMWIHNDMSIKRREEFKYRTLFHFFKNKFKYFDAFVAVSEGIVLPFRNETGIMEKPVTVIPNIINTAEIIEKSKEPVSFHVDQSKLNLVSVGRLCHQKGYDILLKDIADVVKKRQDIHLYIIGDGPEFQTLKKIVEQEALLKYVTFLGNQENPYAYMSQMDAFVLESRYEGQGIVFWEALALGLPIIMPKRLEKYNEGLIGTENVAERILQLKKTTKSPNTLTDYNKNSINKINLLFS
mgnify:CR=1 FL=1